MAVFFFCFFVLEKFNIKRNRASSVMPNDVLAVVNVGEHIRFGRDKRPDESPAQKFFWVDRMSGVIPIVGSYAGSEAAPWLF